MPFIKVPTDRQPPRKSRCALTEKKVFNKEELSLERTALIVLKDLWQTSPWYIKLVFIIVILIFAGDLARRIVCNDWR